MTFLAKIVVGGVLAGLFIAWLWALALRRAMQSAATGAPTPAEAKIEAETAKTAGELATDGAARAKEVTDADQKALLAIARKRWFPGVRK